LLFLDSEEIEDEELADDIELLRSKYSNFRTARFTLDIMFTDTPLEQFLHTKQVEQSGKFLIIN